MNLLDSLDYRLEKWKYQSLLGIRKIVWLYTVIAILALFPMMSIGRLIANTVILKPAAVPVTPYSSEAPKFKIEPATALSYGDKRGFYARVSNKIDDQRKNIGYYPWVYRYAIKDINGKTVVEGTTTSYLLPNADTYIIGPVTDQPGISFEIITDTTRSVAQKFDISRTKLLEIPTVKATNTQTPTPVDNNPNLTKVQFSINNTSNYTINSVDCIFIIRNPDGQIVGIGKYTADDLKKKEIREVSLSYPAPVLGTSATLEVLPQVNYLNEENLKLVVN
jgi:hypothetical protein